MSRNFIIYRDAQRAAPLPTVPYLGVLVSDLTFIMDGNKDTDGALLNYEKYEMIGKIVSEALTIRSKPYDFQPIDYIQDYIINSHILSTQALYEISLTREPRESISSPNVLKRPEQSDQLSPRSESLRRSSTLSDMRAPSPEIPSPPSAPIGKSTSTISFSHLLGEDPLSNPPPGLWAARESSPSSVSSSITE